MVNCCAELADTLIKNKPTDNPHYKHSVPFKTEDTVEPQKLEELGMFDIINSVTVLQ